jgi:hypothetical protein
MVIAHIDPDDGNKAGLHKHQFLSNFYMADCLKVF